MSALATGVALVCSLFVVMLVASTVLIMEGASL